MTDDNSHIDENTNVLLDGLLQSPFFSLPGRKFISLFLSSIDIQSIFLPVRFRNVLNTVPEIKTVNDLANTPSTTLMRMRNIGVTSIAQARSALLEIVGALRLPRLHPEQTKVTWQEEITLIFSWVDTLKNLTMFDDRIVWIIRHRSRNERASDIMLRRLQYKATEQITLTSLGKEYGLTRERIRQIEEKTLNMIRKETRLSKDLIEWIRTSAYIIRKETLIEQLIAAHYWARENKQFFFCFVKRVLENTAVLCLESEYLCIVPVEEIEIHLLSMRDQIVNLVKAHKHGVPINVIASQIKIHPKNPNIDSKKLATADTIRFIARHYGDFQTQGDTVLSEMFYRISFGRKLYDTLYWTLKYLSRPVHYSVAAAFIRKHNAKYRNVTDKLVHDRLVRFPFFVNVDIGTYALTESGIPKHQSAFDALARLIEEQGPVTTKQICAAIGDRYSYSNIRNALVIHARQLNRDNLGRYKLRKGWKRMKRASRSSSDKYM